MKTAVEVFGEVEALVKGREYAVGTTLVLELVRNSSCSAYDCEFVALAEELGVHLVTSDSRVLPRHRGLASRIRRVDFLFFCSSSSSDQIRTSVSRASSRWRRSGKPATLQYQTWHHGRCPRPSKQRRIACFSG
jgi:hypothetical protein